jgi:hypothetical protein
MEKLLKNQGVPEIDRGVRVRSLVINGNYRAVDSLDASSMNVQSDIK